MLMNCELYRRIARTSSCYLQSRDTGWIGWRATTLSCSSSTRPTELIRHTYVLESPPLSTATPEIPASGARTMRAAAGRRIYRSHCFLSTNDDEKASGNFTSWHRAYRENRHIGCHARLNCFPATFTLASCTRAFAVHSRCDSLRAGKCEFISINFGIRSHEECCIV